MKLENNENCFVCGKENKDGLKLDFIVKNKRITANFSFDSRFQGFSGIIHGGIIATILDEAMVKLAFELGFNSVSANLNINLKKPVKPGERVVVTGEIIREFERKLKARAQLRKEDGTLAAEAEGILVKI